jgi:2-iminobutanoate/2-iminopropanoate deaminase
MKPVDLERERRRPSPGAHWRGRGGRLALTAVLLMAAASCTLERRTDQNASPAAGAQSAARSHYREVVQPEGVARLPVFSTAVRNGDLLFLSGQIGTAPGVSPPRLVVGGVEAETRQAFENIRTVLAAAGLGLDNVVKCTVFLADIGDYDAMNSVYVSFFPDVPPARSAMAGSGLAIGARVEIECIAAYPPGR